MDWYEPDTRWDLYAKDKEDFEVKFVVEGKFHKNVPEDIVTDFETVSYLLAHSYYHWPMFDEAMSKVLLIMEMAIKLKAKELEVPTKKGKRDKRLVDIINSVFENEHLRFLKPDFDRARNFRNIKMHPDKLMYMGAIGFTDANARLFVNTINLLFLDIDKLNTLHNNIDQIDPQILPYQKGLHVLEFKDQKILIDGFHTYKYREFENNKLLLLFINPLTTTVHEQFVEHKYPEPLIITFTEFKISEDIIEGIDLEGTPMKIYIDNKYENFNTYYDYNLALRNISKSDASIFFDWSGNKAIWKMERIIYENCWSNNREKLELR